MKKDNAYKRTISLSCGIEGKLRRGEESLDERDGERGNPWSVVCHHAIGRGAWESRAGEQGRRKSPAIASGHGCSAGNSLLATTLGVCVCVRERERERERKHTSRTIPCSKETEVTRPFGFPHKHSEFSQDSIPGPCSNTVLQV